MKCKQCRWYDDRHKRLKTLDIEDNMGLCRKHKPFIIKYKDVYFGSWPVVDENDFCGEYREVK